MADAERLKQARKEGQDVETHGNDPVSEIVRSWTSSDDEKVAFEAGREDVRARREEEEERKSDDGTRAFGGLL